MPHRDGWKPLLDELERRQTRARAMGGPERVARLMHGRGKLDARQRIDQLFDPGTFVEIGALIGGEDIPADALVAGFGKIDGRTAFAGAEDFSVLGGSIGIGAMAKRYRICELARAGARAARVHARRRGPSPHRARSAAAAAARRTTCSRSPISRVRCRWCASCSARRPGTARSPRRSPTSRS